MKYLQLYEAFKNEFSLQEFLDIKFGKDYNFNELEELMCDSQKLIDLKGIEKMPNLKQLYCFNNKLTSLKEIETLIELKILHFSTNYISNLKSIEKLINLTELHCEKNELRNLNGIEKLPLLEFLFCNGNLWEFPLKPELVEKYNISYSEDDIEEFKSYKLQKEFIKKYPERADELKEFGFHLQILEEFPALITACEWGFFGLVE